MKAKIIMLAAVALLGCSRHEDPIACQPQPDANRLVVDNNEVVYKIGKERLGKDFPDSDAPGFELARTSLAAVLILADRVNSGSGDDVKDIYPNLAGLEALWPDELSANGQQIGRDLWFCHDALSLGRMQFEMLLKNDPEAAVYAGKVATAARENCALALTAASKHS